MKQKYKTKIYIFFLIILGLSKEFHTISNCIIDFKLLFCSNQLPEYDVFVDRGYSNELRSLNKNILNCLVS